MSASPCWISRRREAGSGTFLIMMLLIFGAPVGVGLQHDGLMRLVDAHFIGPAARRVHLQPVVAEVVIFAFGATCFSSTIEAMGVERIFSATAGLTSAVQCSVRVWSSTFQLAGDVVRLPAEHVENKRWRFIQRHRAGVEKITSSGRSGLPEANLASGFSLMVRVFAAGSACQLSARIGTIFQGCCGPAAPDADRGWGPSECWRVR